ncbi:MAG TPA: Lrp/AsnC family transcriptional regulator [Methanomassiliicoccales archaeon]|jgi:Lrp/AsnC family leucine-responsive transcriptional regulator
MSNTELDETDAAIIKTLLRDARTNLKDMAEANGVSTNAVFKRIEKLRSNGIIVGSATIFNPKAIHELMAATVEMTVDFTDIENVVESLRGHPNVLLCFECIGRCNVFALIGARSVSDLDAVKEEIRQKRGVRKIAVAMRVDELEFLYDNLDIGPIGGVQDG